MREVVASIPSNQRVMPSITKRLKWERARSEPVRPRGSLQGCCRRQSQAGRTLLLLEQSPVYDEPT